VANTRFGIDIVADDLTGKGFNNADKQAKGFASAQDKRNKSQQKFEADFAKAKAKAEKDRQDRLKATGAGAAGRGFSAAESAFGGGAISGAVSGKLGAVAAAGNSIKSAFAAANHEGAGLAEKLGAISVAGAAATGIIAGLAIAAYKMASGWTEGGAALGRLSAGIGMSTDQLQRWQGAGEKFGVDKDTMGGAIGSFASTMNDAKYGRNNTALAAMNQLGIQMKTGPDGNIDVGAMFSDASDAVKRQTNPQTQKRIVELLGIGDGALPAIRQGGTALRDAGAEYAKYGGMWSSQDVKDSTRLYGEGVQARQGLDREGKGFQRAAALTGEGAMTAAIAHDRARVDGSGGGSAVVALGNAAKWTEGAVSHLGTAIGSLAYRIEHLGERSRQDQVSPKGARGVMQVMPETARETAIRHGIPWDESRYRNDKAYSRQLGTAYLGDGLEQYGGDEVLAAARYNAGPGAVNKWIKRYGDPRKGQISDADFAKHIPYKETRDYVDRVVPNQSERRTILEITGLPAGAKVVARTNGKPVAVAHAMAGSGP
jgi:hypothetical protein